MENISKLTKNNPQTTQKDPKYGPKCCPDPAQKSYPNHPGKKVSYLPFRGRLFGPPKAHFSQKNETELIKSQ